MEKTICSIGTHVLHKYLPGRIANAIVVLDKGPLSAPFEYLLSKFTHGNWRLEKRPPWVLFVAIRARRTTLHEDCA